MGERKYEHNAECEIEIDHTSIKRVLDEGFQVVLETKHPDTGETRYLMISEKKY